MSVDWSLLESNQRLERERGAREVAKLLASSDGVRVDVERRTSLLLEHATWEVRHGGLLVLQTCLRPHRGSEAASTADLERWAAPCMKLLSDTEVRVRTLAGETLALLCETGGLPIYDDHIAEPLLAAIERNMMRDRDAEIGDDEASRALAEKLLAGEAAREKLAWLKPEAAGVSKASSVQSTIFHDTAGWGTLETDLACLQQIIEKCGAQLAPRLVERTELMELLTNCAVHMNRFVREIGFRALDSVVRCIALAEREAKRLPSLEAVVDASDLVQRLNSGLCDEWPQVRMEASVTLRSFLVGLQTAERRERYYGELLPRMCLNRYYVAVGVSGYSLETWRLVLGSEGKAAVVRWLPSIVPFYILQTKIACSEARDAAAKCIGELAARVERNAVEPYAEQLFEALVPRLGKADAWEVRGSTCNTVVQMVREFPDKFNLLSMPPLLLPLLSALLSDVVWSVREASAQALGELVRVSRAEAASSLLDLCLEGLSAASLEPDECQKYGASDLAALKRERANDREIHTNQTTIDCCAVGDLDENDSEQLGILNLSKIFQNAKKQMESIDYGTNRWERTDGCFYLVRELALTGKLQLEGESGTTGRGLIAALPLMARASTLRHFVNHTVLLTTLWSVLPAIAHAVGVGCFTPHFQGFAEALRYSLSCQDRLLAAAAQTCAAELDRLLRSERLEALPADVRAHYEAAAEALATCRSLAAAGGASPPMVQTFSPAARC